MTRRTFLFALCLLPVIAGPAIAAPPSMPTPWHHDGPPSAPSTRAAWDPYDPPVRDAEPPAGAPVISHWTRTAGADEHVILAGHNFRPDGGGTRFHIFAQGADRTIRAEAESVHIEQFQAIIRLPDSVPAGAMALIAPENAAGVGRPVPVNKPELWYILPRKVNPGGELSLYGRNLARGEPARGWVLLVPKDDGRARLLESVSANPYKVDFNVPDDLPVGTWEVWAHSGAGGEYGWSALHAGRGGSLAPRELKVVEPRAWDGPTLDVTDFGARGDDAADDTDAALKALAEANETPNATILFPAGTYYLSAALGPVHGPDNTGVRIMGEGMDRTFVKGNPDKLPSTLLKITGGGVEVRDMVWDINELGEERKFYRDAARGAHNPAHYRYLEKVKKAREAIKRWKKKNKGKPVPESMQPPPSPPFPDVRAKQALVGGGGKREGKRRVIVKEGWNPDIRFINCVLDAERRILSFNGLVDSLFENCDIIARECQMGVPQFTRIRRCNFFGRADAPVLMYMYGGWCNSVTECTGQDYMPNTYDTCMGRFYTVSAYGNRQENIYVGENRTKDLTVQPTHFNQNSGEQIMWEFMPLHSTQKPAAVEGRTLTFAEPIKGKVKWYSDAIVVAGRGLGQYRRIADYDKASGVVTLVEPWDVPPDTDSTVVIGQPIRRVVAHGNYLDAKPRAASVEHHIASAGVEPFGSSVDLIVANNTFHELRSGIATFGTSLFHHYAGNRCEGVRYAGTWGAGTGFVVRGNTIDGAVERGWLVSGDGTEDVSVLEVIEHDTGSDLPAVLVVGNRYNKEVARRKTVVYGNAFRRGNAGSPEAPAIRTSTPEMLILDDNRFEGFGRAVGER